MNKKNLLSIIILSMLFLNITPSFAQDNTNEYKTASTLVRVTTNMFGYNFITRHIAQNVIKKTLNKNVKGDYTVKIDSFSGVDLKKGKFRGLIIDGKDLCLEDSIYFSKLHLETTSNFNYVDYSKKPIVFKTDVPMDYVVEITEDDLNKTVEKDNFFNSFSAMIPLVSIDKFKFQLTDNKVRLNTAIRFPFSKSIKFSISGSPKIENGKIILTDIQTSGTRHDFSERIANVMNNYNLLENIKLNLFNGTDSTMTVKNVKVQDKKICIDGNLVIKKA